jgi:hypothetical protein
MPLPAQRGIRGQATARNATGAIIPQLLGPRQRSRGEQARRIAPNTPQRWHGLCEVFNRLTIEVNERRTAIFRSHFGPNIVFDLGRQTASEDFSAIPDAFGTPYTYWGVGCTDPQKYQRALDAGRVEQDIPVNHSEYFAPVIEPTLSNGTQALVVAALTYLSK